MNKIAFSILNKFHENYNKKVFLEYIKYRVKDQNAKMIQGEKAERFQAYRAKINQKRMKDRCYGALFAKMSRR